MYSIYVVVINKHRLYDLTLTQETSVQTMSLQQPQDFPLQTLAEVPNFIGISFEGKECYSEQKDKLSSLQIQGYHLSFHIKGNEWTNLSTSLQDAINLGIIVHVKSVPPKPVFNEIQQRREQQLLRASEIKRRNQAKCRKNKARSNAGSNALTLLGNVLNNL